MLSNFMPVVYICIIINMYMYVYTQHNTSVPDKRVTGHSCSYKCTTVLITVHTTFACGFQVQRYSSEILLYVLQSQLLLPPARWQQVIETTALILPVLQVGVCRHFKVIGSASASRWLRIWCASSTTVEKCYILFGHKVVVHVSES